MDESTYQLVLCIGIPVIIVLLVLGIMKYLEHRSKIKTLAFLNCGDNAFLKGDYQAAESQYSLAVKDTTNQLKSLFSLGILSFLKKDFSKTIDLFSKAFNAKGSSEYSDLIAKCNKLKITPDDKLFECFRTAEYLYLDQKFDALNYDIEAKVTTSAHLWGSTLNPGLDSSNYIILGKDTTQIRIAKPVVEIEHDGTIIGKAEFTPMDGGIRLLVNIIHKVHKLQSSPNDRLTTISPEDARSLSDTAIIGLLTQWKIMKEERVLDKMYRQVDRALGVVKVFSQTRMMGYEIADVEIHNQVLMPVFWHESVSRRETLTGTEWKYTLHQWDKLIFLDCRLTFKRDSWFHGKFDYSKDNIKKIQENTQISFLNKYYSG